MKAKPGLKVSIIIPVHNEEKMIRDCLKSIKKQKVAPYEVIVVDNNSTDNTIKIVNRFKWVKVIKERNQGQRFAQVRGFNKAKGDVLVRLDADTILPSDYISRIINIFLQINIAGVTGYGISRFEAFPGISKLWDTFYFRYVHAYFGYPILWGANMAIKKTYWDRLKHHLIFEDVHEDQDISLALASVGGRAFVDKDLIVSVKMEGMHHIGKYHSYVKKMKYLKKLDKSSTRVNLKRRLKKTNIALRIYYWLTSAWSVYAFYPIALIYSTYWHINLFLRTH